jgi:hypothetical protein
MDEKHMIWLIIAFIIGFFLKYIIENLVCKNVCPLVEGIPEAEEQQAGYEEYEDMEKERLRMRTAFSGESPDAVAADLTAARKAEEKLAKELQAERERRLNAGGVRLAEQGRRQEARRAWEAAAPQRAKELEAERAAEAVRADAAHLKLMRELAVEKAKSDDLEVRTLNARDAVIGVQHWIDDSGNIVNNAPPPIVLTEEQEEMAFAYDQSRL